MRSAKDTPRSRHAKEMIVDINISCLQYGLVFSSLSWNGEQQRQQYKSKYNYRPLSYVGREFYCYPNLFLDWKTFAPKEPTDLDDNPFSTGKPEKEMTDWIEEYISEKKLKITKNIIFDTWIKETSEEFKKLFPFQYHIRTDKVLSQANDEGWFK